MAWLTWEQISNSAEFKSFITILKQTLPLVWQRVLTSISPYVYIASWDWGYPAYLKRIEFAEKIIANPELYALRCARILQNQDEGAYLVTVIWDCAAKFETSIASSPARGLLYYIYDVCANILIDDLDRTS